MSFRKVSVLALLGLTALIGILSGQGPSHAAVGGVFGTVTVTTAADNDAADGLCSYREAIKAQNMDAAYNGCTSSGSGPDRIVFDLGTGPVINISVLPVSLPLITATVEIDGGSERVELRGGAGNGYAAWLSTAAASGSIIHNLAMNRFSTAIVIDTDVSGVHVMGNFIGTDASGTVGTGNKQQGILVRGPNALIGGTDGWEPGGSCTGQCNLISGHADNSRAIRIDATGTGAVVQGNMVGTDVTGTDPLANENGISSAGANVLIGGESPGEGNLIGNGVFRGVNAEGDGTTIQGNFFGTDTTGNGLLDDELTGTAIGVQGVENTLIGGTSAGARNVIAFPNGIRGVQSAFNTQIFGNFIGTGADGTTPLVPSTVTESSIGVDLASASGTKVGGIDPGQGNVIAFRGIGVDVSALFGPGAGNQIRGNSIHSNTGLGINTHDGGNGESTPPVITSANQSGASGTASPLDCANSMCAVDIYSDDEDEGRIYEGSTQTDLAGNWTFSGSLNGPNVTATITNDGGNTSEFSAPFTMEIPTPTPSPTPTASPTPTVTATPSVTPSPTTTASASPTPTATPHPGTQRTWSDADCSGAIAPRDSQAGLKHFLSQAELSQTEPCPDIGSIITFDGVSYTWGDWDCSGAIAPRDSQAGLKHFLSQAELSQTEPCPNFGATGSVVP